MGNASAELSGLVSASRTPSSTRARWRTRFAASASRASRCRRSPSWPTRRRIDPCAASATPTRTAADARNLWRVHWYNDLAGGRVDVPDHVVLPTALTGVDSPIIVVFGDRFPMITRPQGARRLRLPGAARRHRPVRPDPAPGDLAVDGQLRPRRHRHQPDHGQPRRGDPARGDEPGALRLARPVVREPGRRRHPHARHGEQRQGDLRRLQRAGAGSRRNFVLNQFCEFGNHLGHYEVTGRALGHVFDTCAAGEPRPAARRVRRRPPARPARSPPATG